MHRVILYYIFIYLCIMRHCDLCVRRPFHTTIPLSLFCFFSSSLLIPLSYLFLFVCLPFRLCLFATRCEFYYEFAEANHISKRILNCRHVFAIFLSRIRRLLPVSSDNRHKMICENTNFRFLPFHICFD